MTSRLRIGIVPAIAIGIVVLGYGVLKGQEPQRQDSTAVLLSEVHALRVAIEQMATASARVQLVMGRLQMQEQRVGDGVKRLDMIRAQLAGAEQMISGHQGEVARLERQSQSAPDAAERAAAEEQLKRASAGLAGAQAQAQRLRNDEADAASAVAVEQGRWSDINQQLEELDRILRKTPQ